MGNKSGRPSKIWTAEKIEYLIKNYDPKKIGELSVFLQIPNNKIKDKASYLRITKNIWTKDQEVILTNEFNSKKIKELANKLGKSVDSIKGKMSNLKLRKRQFSYTNEEINSVRILRDKKYRYREIASELNISIHRVNNIIRCINKK